MRPSGLPDPRKLWGKIDRDLYKNDNISVKISYNYDVNYYEGKKKIILSNTTIFGGKNTSGSFQFFSYSTFLICMVSSLKAFIESSL